MAACENKSLARFSLASQISMDSSGGSRNNRGIRSPKKRQPSGVRREIRWWNYFGINRKEKTERCFLNTENPCGYYTGMACEENWRKIKYFLSLNIRTKGPVPTIQLHLMVRIRTENRKIPTSHTRPLIFLYNHQTHQK